MARDGFMDLVRPTCRRLTRRTGKHVHGGLRVKQTFTFPPDKVNATKLQETLYPTLHLCTWYSLLHAVWPVAMTYVDSKLAQGLYTWPVTGIEPQTLRSWVLRLNHSARRSTWTGRAIVHPKFLLNNRVIEHAVRNCSLHFVIFILITWK
jgi:hypothetical protein